eukprot:Amastigsp_a179417_38.p4 type:complete len:116 gc:universal Amastigsp_a179417_38:400-747(+)
MTPERGSVAGSQGRGRVRIPHAPISEQESQRQPLAPVAPVLQQCAPSAPRRGRASRRPRCARAHAREPRPPRRGSAPHRELAQQPCARGRAQKKAQEPRPAAKVQPCVARSEDRR